MKNAPVKLLSLAIIGALISACASPQIVHNPKTGRLPTDAVRLALVLSDKTRYSVGNFHGVIESMMRRSQTPAAGFADLPNRPFDAVNDVLKKDFAEVSIVDTAEQAKAGGADVIAVLDYDVSFIDFSADVTFLNAEEKQIDLLHVEAHRKSCGFCRGFTLVREASEEIGVKLENAIADSQPLAAYARERADRSPAPVAPGPAPSAPPIRSGPVSDVDSPTYVADEKPDNFAVVVGIEKYSSVPDASFAERDAEAMHNHLLALGYPERNIIYLIGEKATRSSIQKYIEMWLPKNVKEDSQVVFYFSGHGAPDPASKQAYLVPWDGDPKFLENTAYPIAQLYKSLAALKVQKVLVALDSCFSGAGGRSVIARGTRPLVMKIDTSIPEEAGSLAVLSASAGDQITGADDSQGHGLFTYYLLRALNGTDGKISVKDAYASLVPKVEDAARRQNREQTPQFVPGSGAAYFR
jgi:hypothetical protein